MKRVLSILLVTLLAFSAMSIMAVNATGNPTFVVGSTTINAGDTTVTVPVSIENGAAISYYDFTVNYSAEDLQLTKITDSKAGGDVTINNNKGVMSVVFEDNTAINGEIATLTFNVLDGAKTSTVSLTTTATSLDFETFESTDVIYACTPGTITVPAAVDPVQEQLEQAMHSGTSADAADTWAQASGFTSFSGLEMLGVQTKTDASDVRFVTAVSKYVLTNESVTDYGYIFARTSKTPEAVANTIGNLTVDKAQNKFSCKGSDNTLAGDYGDPDSDTSYKYVTAGVKNIAADKTVVARFYVETSDGTTYYYAAYGNLAGIAYRPAVA